MNKQKPIVSKTHILRDSPVFDKRTIIELVENQMTSINGGTGCWTKFGVLTEKL